MRLHRVLAFAIIVLLSFGLGNTTAIAQTTYQFEATYNVESMGEPIQGDILRVGDKGESTNAPYGLSKVENSAYALFNPETSNVIKVSADPATFGLKGEDFPFGKFVLSGQGSDKLFGTETGSSTYDFENLVGSGSYTITITGGKGKFRGAKGLLKFSETNVLSPDPTAPIKGTWLVSGSFQTAP
jgi:hypothetical protein